jgi:hypothetical protein
MIAGHIHAYQWIVSYRKGEFQLNVSFEYYCNLIVRVYVDDEVIAYTGKIIYEFSEAPNMCHDALKMLDTLAVFPQIIEVKPLRPVLLY